MNPLSPPSLLSPPYLRWQADRCQRLSRNCMDLTTARDLRVMSEEYFAEATATDADTAKALRGIKSTNTAANKIS